MSRAARIAIAALGVAVVAIVILVVVLVEHVGESESTATKRVPPEDMRRYDTTVVLPSGASAFTVADVEDRMNRLGLVQQYAEVTRETLAVLVSRGDADSDALKERVCTTATRGYAVALTRPTSDSRRQLARTLGDDATVLPSEYRRPQPEIFMRVKATAEQTHAVKARLDRDTDIATFQFLDHKAAYEEFRRLFGDQPQLIQSEPADGSGLPESFRIELRDGAAPADIAARYGDLPGVDMVNVPSSRSVLPVAGLFDLCPGR
jgi:hypothetical protein